MKQFVNTLKEKDHVKSVFLIKDKKLLKDKNHSDPYLLKIYKNTAAIAFPISILVIVLIVLI